MSKLDYQPGDTGKFSSWALNHTPETLPNNQGSGDDKTPDVQPTPEPLIECSDCGHKAKGMVAFYLHAAKKHGSHQDVESAKQLEQLSTPTPESNIEEQMKIKSLIEQLFMTSNNDAQLKIRLAKNIQALLTAADQAGYTRGKGETELEGFKLGWQIGYSVRRAEESRGYAVSGVADEHIFEVVKAQLAAEQEEL